MCQAAVDLALLRVVGVNARSILERVGYQAGGVRVRVRFAVKLALAFAIVAALAGSLVPGGSARANSGGPGDFIIRCFYNGNVAAQDPIEAPGNLYAEHLHVFFGNMAAGGAAVTQGGTQVPFPGIQSGDNGSPSSGTMEKNGLTTATNCQDSNDTAGYWVPEPFMVTSGVATPWLPGGANGCSTNCTATGPNANLYQRDYYVPHAPTTPPSQEIPDGTIMVTGYPTGCMTVRSGFVPTGCSANDNPTYPVNRNIIEYSCGADQKTNDATPLSAWPYNCSHYVSASDPDDSYSDGAVAMVKFPDCWDGQLPGNFPAPNSPANAQGLPTTMVPGYVAPWIKYDVWNTTYKMPARPVNDFAYANADGTCPQGFVPVVRLEERLHLLTYGAGWGSPSTCSGDGGIGWNSLQNSEMSTNSSDTPPGGDNDGDATVTVATGVYGPWQCKSVNAPNPSAGATTLSFACSHSGDPNCNIQLTAPTGCVTKTGVCYVGAGEPGSGGRPCTPTTGKPGRKPPPATATWIRAAR
jgi:hypothetical protein